MPKLKDLFHRTYSPNQVVALNIARARAMRGWTQEQASEALAPYLGTRWSNASFSAVERSIAGARVKQFSADELVALARGFDLPLGWFFLPPPPEEDAGLHSKEAGSRGVDMGVLLDIVLGTPTSTPPWRDALLAYAAATAGSERVPGHGNVEERLEGLAELRAANELRQAFGDVAEARDVLLRLAGMLDRLSGPEPADPSHEPARTGTKAKGARRSTS
jgi:transcriptional regulator with XRE-family HTH domain